MSTINSFPKELLLQIISYLNLPTIENLAKTYNYGITPTCLPFIRPLLARRQRFKALVARFGSSSLHHEIDYYDGLVEEAARFGITSMEQEAMQKPSAMRFQQRIEHLLHHFTGTLSWLSAIPLQHDLTPNGSIIEKDYVALTPTEMSDLESSAKALGLVLPPAFIKLFTDADLMQHIPADEYTTLQINGGLHKIPAAADNGAGEYCIPMCEAPGNYWSLYLFPDGTHCVLDTPYEAANEWIDMDDERYAEIYQASAEEVEDGREMANVSRVDSLEGVNFEEWLYSLCCANGIKLVCYEGESAWEGLVELVRTMYVEGNEMP